MKSYRWAGWAISIFLLLGMCFFVFSFGYTSLRKISLLNLKKTAAELDEKKKSLAFHLRDQEEWKDIHARYQEFRKSYVPPFSEFPDCRDQFKSAAAGLGIKLVSFSHQYHPLADDIVKIDIKLDLAGSYQAIKEFLFQIEQMEKLFIVKNVQFFRKNTDVSATFRIEVYFEK